MAPVICRIDFRGKGRELLCEKSRGEGFGQKLECSAEESRAVCLIRSFQAKSIFRSVKSPFAFSTGPAVSTVKTPLTNLPVQYFAALEPLFVAAKENLERDGLLVPFAFIGDFSTQQIMPLQISTASREAKIESARQITRTAEHFAADFVAIAMECYTLDSGVHLHEDIIERYDSIAESPYGIAVVSFSIETPTTIWMAQCPVVALGASKSLKTFVMPQPTDFQGYKEASGVFVGLLPGSRIVGPAESVTVG